MELVWERRVGVWDSTRYYQEMLGLTIRTACGPGPHLGEWEDASRYYRNGEEPKVTPSLGRGRPLDWRVGICFSAHQGPPSFTL